MAISAVTSTVFEDFQSKLANWITTNKYYGMRPVKIGTTELIPSASTSALTISSSGAITLTTGTTGNVTIGIGIADAHNQGTTLLISGSPQTGEGFNGTYTANRIDALLESAVTSAVTSAITSAVGSIGNGTITVKRNGTLVNSFTVNQTGATEVNIPLMNNGIKVNGTNSAITDLELSGTGVSLNSGKVIITDTNTVREVKVNGTSFLGASETSKAINIVNAAGLDITTTANTGNFQIGLKMAGPQQLGGILLFSEQAGSPGGVQGTYNANYIDTNFVKKTDYVNFHVEVLSGSSLPTTGETNVLYLLNDKTESGNTYSEYIYANSKWEKIGDTTVDLSNYWSNTDLVEMSTDQGTAMFNKYFK